MMKDRWTRYIVITAGLSFAASSQAALLVDLNASDSGAADTWTSSGGSFPGWYNDEAQHGPPVKATDANGVTYFSVAPAEGGFGFFGGDESGGTQQHVSGDEPQFTLNGTNPGDFTYEIWMRKRGNRLHSAASILGMKSADGNERFTVNLYDGDDEGRIDINMRAAAGPSVLELDVYPLFNKGGDDPFDHFVFAWDNSASTMDVFHGGSNVIPNLSFPGVTLSPSTVFDGTTTFINFANDGTSGGVLRFNGDIARVRIHDEILSQGDIDASFAVGPNGIVPEPGTMALLALGGGMALALRGRRSERNG